MFLIGYALRLGADNVQIGLMSTIPMLCVVAQMVSAATIEAGASRKRLTVVFSFLNVSGWAFAILIPHLFLGSSSATKVGILIAVITLVTFFGSMAGNARASWIGDLIPARFMSRFFSNIVLYGGIVGMAFALIEGAFLDVVKGIGLSAFGVLFGFGMIFGYINAALFMSQPDAPAPGRKPGASFLGLVRGTFTNVPLMALMGCWILWCLQSIAGPFVATYMLRDLRMPFLGVGIVNAVLLVSMLASSRFWGGIVERYGCRPVLIGCMLLIALTPLSWVFVTTAARVYMIMIPVNIYAGLVQGGIPVAINTLLYRVTPSTGRSVQFAIYSIVVTLFAAPMPLIGGYLPDWLNAMGLKADLRWTFYACVPCMLAAAFAARYVREKPAPRGMREMLRSLPRQLPALRLLAKRA